MANVTKIRGVLRSFVIDHTPPKEVPDDTPLDKQPEFQGTITMQVRAHARNQREFVLKMEALAIEAIQPVVSNGTMHGGLDRFHVDLVRDMRVPSRPGQMHRELIEVDVVAPNDSMAECVAREAVSRICTDYLEPYQQGRVYTARLVR